MQSLTRSTPFALAKVTRPERMQSPNWRPASSRRSGWNLRFSVISRARRQRRLQRRLFWGCLCLLVPLMSDVLDQLFERAKAEYTSCRVCSREGVLRSGEWNKRNEYHITTPQDDPPPEWSKAWCSNCLRRFGWFIDQTDRLNRVPYKDRKHRRPSAEDADEFTAWYLGVLADRIESGKTIVMCQAISFLSGRQCYRYSTMRFGSISVCARHGVCLKRGVTLHWSNQAARARQ